MMVIDNVCLFLSPNNGQMTMMIRQCLLVQCSLNYFNVLYLIFIIHVYGICHMHMQMVNH
jgi:hypothetical protein